MTVCIPVFNAMPHLPEALGSILAQTFPDFRILVIDDGSTDGSLAYLQSVVDSRLTLIHQENIGLTGTLNRMLSLLGSGWMVRQDADDIALPTRLAKLQQVITEFPQAGMIYSHAAHYQQGSFKGRLLTTPTDETGLRSFLKEGYLPSICHPTIALRVDAALALGGYRFDLHVEDYDLYWRMGLDFDVRMIPEVLLGYRMTGSSISDQNARKQAANVLYVQYLLLSTLWGQKSLSHSEVGSLLEQMVDYPHLAFRTHMRSAMSRLGEKRYGTFVSEVCRAFLASPPSFLRRFLQSGPELARIGASPELYRARSSQLWPNT